MLDEHPDTKLYVVGEYGRHFFTQHNIPMEHSFLYTAQNPTMQRAREICDILLEGYDRGDFKKIFVIYTDMENSLTSSAHCTRLLPFHRAYFQTDTVEKAVTTPFEFVPSVQAVLNNIMQSYVSGFIYSALIDSFCSEQNARMTAMDSANSNAEKLLAELFPCSITACVRLPSRRRLQRSPPVRRHSVKNTGRKREQREYR